MGYLAAAEVDDAKFQQEHNSRVVYVGQLVRKRYAANEGLIGSGRHNLFSEVDKLKALYI